MPSPIPPAARTYRAFADIAPATSHPASRGGPILEPQRSDRSPHNKLASRRCAVHDGGIVLDLPP
jgi:hypothetical protein